jgi:ATP-binding cassette subfamily F protein 3
MSLITVHHVGKSFGAERLFRDVTFQVNEHDRIGLVGPNGAGKSTLLKLLAGREEPDEGTISVARGTRIGYLSQTLDLQPHHTLREELLTVFATVHSWEAQLHALATEIAAATTSGDALLREQLLQRHAELQLLLEHAGGYTYEYRIQQVLDGLGFSREEQETSVGHLSGGQQTRLALAKLLLQEPDLLLLDEPTNHLDLAALEWLENYLQEWKGALVIVEHDRYFLDKVVTQIIELAFGSVEEYPGNYTRYLRLREERLERRQREYEEQQEYIQRTEEFIRRYKAGQRSRQARGREKLLSRLERLSRPRDIQEMRFELKPVVESGQLVLGTKGLVVGYPPAGPGTAARPLVRLPDLEVLRGERIGLVGPNGAGKTTLLRTIIGRLQPLQGSITLGHNVRIGYYSQSHEGLHPEHTILDEVRQLSALSEDGARDFLARFLFEGDDVFKTIATLSGGERSRVILARLTLQGANCLVLDEPTNHLDLQSRQFLEEVLDAFSGTLLFVSHDRYFIDRLASKVWIIEDGQLTPYDGNYTDYRLRRRAGEQSGRRSPATLEDGRQGGKERRTRRGGTPSKGRSVSDVEQEIEACEVRSKSLEAALNAAAFEGNAAELSRLAQEYEQVRVTLDELLSEWERLASTSTTGQT